MFPSHAPFHLSTAAYAACVLFGLVSGLLVVVATALVYFAEDLFHRLSFYWMLVARARQDDHRRRWARRPADLRGRHDVIGRARRKDQPGLVVGIPS